MPAPASNSMNKTTYYVVTQNMEVILLGTFDTFAEAWDRRLRLDFHGHEVVIATRSDLADLKAAIEEVLA